MAKLQDLPELTEVASDQQSAGRTLKVEIDRDVAALFGIKPATIDSTLYDAFGQRHVARIYTTLNEYYVILEVNPQLPARTQCAAAHLCPIRRAARWCR